MRKIILLLLLIPLVSCQDVEKTNSSVKNVLLDINMDGELRLSEIADTVEVILLEQTMIVILLWWNVLFHTRTDIT